MSEVQLLQEAGLQHGYFTTAQAETLGVTRRALIGWLQRGLVERSSHGVYRLTHYLESPLDQLYALQAAAPMATFSHETALELYGLSDVLPRTIHMTVPPESGLKPRRGVTVHRSRIESPDRVLREDLWMTSLARTLLDCARSGSDADQLLAAAQAGRARGMLGPRELHRLSKTYPFAGRL